MVALRVKPARWLVATLLALMAAAAVPALARAGTANAGLAGAPAGNPLAGMRWGNYSGPLDEVFPAYRASRGANRRLLAKIALRPRVRWFGSWYKDSQAEQTVHQYIANATHGNPNVLAQLAVFRLDPWESAACHSLPSAAQQASYRTWIQNFAQGIGSSRVALILQPDLPFAACVPGHSKLPLQMVAYAAQLFSALPHTTVYIDAGAADWASVGEAVALLRGAGVEHARGFALGATHYASTASEIGFGHSIVRRLAADHIPNRHFVINTAQNGRPFTYQQYHGPDYDNAAVCTSRHSARCVTLGIPPTWHVAARRWGLSRGVRRLAARDVDAYLWIGRPWLDNQSDPFDLERALALARTTPF
jgi:endoglucanase